MVGCILWSGNQVSQANPAGFPDSDITPPENLSCHSQVFGNFVPDRAATSGNQYSSDTIWTATAADGTTATLRAVTTTDTNSNLVIRFEDFTDANTGYTSPKLVNVDGDAGDQWILEIAYSRPIGNARLLLGDIDGLRAAPSAKSPKFLDVVNVTGYLESSAVSPSDHYINSSFLQASSIGNTVSFQLADINNNENPRESAIKNRALVDFEDRFIDRIQLTYEVGVDINDGAVQSIFTASGEASGCNISGVTFEDRTLNDLFNSGEPLLENAATSIFLDDGDGLFETDGSDLLIETVDTNTNGAYEFTLLAENSNYWISVNESDPDLDGYTYSGGDVEAAEVNPRVVALSISDVTGINFPFSAPVTNTPNVILVKRITAINRGLDNEQLFDSSYVDHGTASDNDNIGTWPGTAVDPTTGPGTGMVDSYLAGLTNGVTIEPGDEVEYTIYFLSNGTAQAQNVVLCDRIPDFLDFVTESFNTSPPQATGGTVGANRGIAFSNATTDVSLTNLDDGDSGAYISSVGDALTHCQATLPSGTEDNGFVTISLGDLATNDYGLVRFRGRVR